MPRIALSSHPPARPAEGERPLSNVAFDGIIVTLGAWFLGGLYLDGWAHKHIARDALLGHLQLREPIFTSSMKAIMYKRKRKGN
jgi:hypothetical protein